MENHEQNIDIGNDKRVLKTWNYFTKFEGQIKRLDIKWKHDEELRCVAFRIWAGSYFYCSFGKIRNFYDLFRFFIFDSLIQSSCVITHLGEMRIKHIH